MMRWQSRNAKEHEANESEALFRERRAEALRSERGMTLVYSRITSLVGRRTRYAALLVGGDAVTDC